MYKQGRVRYRTPYLYAYSFFSSSAPDPLSRWRGERCSLWATEKTPKQFRYRDLSRRSLADLRIIELAQCPVQIFFVQQMSACWRGRYLSVLVEGSSSCRKTGVSCWISAPLQKAINSAAGTLEIELGASSMGVCCSLGIPRQQRASTPLLLMEQQLWTRIKSKTRWKQHYYY